MINIVDVVIILMILMFGVIGFKRGVFKELVTTVGTIIVIILAFYLKNPLANFLSLNLPFFNFGGPFLGLTSLNIVLYQLVAFCVVSGLLSIILNLIVSVTGIFEKILKYTIILGIPSKILGAIVGFIEGFIVIFIILFFISQPAFNVPMLKESKFAPIILKSTPGLSYVVKDFNDAFSDIYELSNKYIATENKNEFNKETVHVLLKYKLVKVDHVSNLVEKGKLRINGIDSVLNQYR